MLYHFHCGQGAQPCYYKQIDWQVDWVISLPRVLAQEGRIMLAVKRASCESQKPWHFVSPKEWESTSCWQIIITIQTVLSEQSHSTYLRCFSSRRMWKTTLLHVVDKGEWWFASTNKRGEKDQTEGGLSLRQDLWLVDQNCDIVIFYRAWEIR